MKILFPLVESENLGFLKRMANLDYNVSGNFELQFCPNWAILYVVFLL